MLPHSRIFPAAVFSFNIGWDARGLASWLPWIQKNLTGMALAYSFCTGVAVIQVIIEACVTEDDHSIGFCCFHCAAKGVHAEKIPTCRL